MNKVTQQHQRNEELLKTYLNYANFYLGEDSTIVFEDIKEYGKYDNFYHITQVSKDGTVKISTNAILSDNLVRLDSVISEEFDLGDIKSIEITQSNYGFSLTDIAIENKETNQREVISKAFSICRVERNAKGDYADVLKIAEVDKDFTLLGKLEETKNNTYTKMN